MSYNNAAEVNDECEKAMTTSLLDLNDYTLLQVFSYLNLRDSINFAGSSKRLKSVGSLHFTKYKRLDLFKYERFKQPEKLPAETILFYIGQHIKTLTITSMRSTVAKAILDNCVNVTSLDICKDTTNLKEWMQQLKLERLAIGNCRDINEKSIGLQALKELRFTYGNYGLCAVQLTNILEKTTELETLTVNLMFYRHFNFDIFTKLPKLQCLEIEIKSADLVNLTEFLKMDVLTRFKLRLHCGADTLSQLNSFLEILAERSKLNELELRTRFADQSTLRVLKSFQVASLEFLAVNFVEDRWMIHQLVDAQPNLKHLDFLRNNIPIDHVDFVVRNLVKLETFTFLMRREELGQLNELRINEILKTTTSRPTLTLYINFNSVKIELRFEQRKYRIVQLDNDDDDEVEDSYFLTDSFIRRV